MVIYDFQEPYLSYMKAHGKTVKRCAEVEIPQEIVQKILEALVKEDKKSC